jgi:hypothetical protein
MIWSPNVENLEGGNVSVVNFPATQPVSATDLDIRDLNSASDSVTAIGPLTDAQLRATPVPVTSGTAAVATVTNVAVSAVVATLAASNASRLKLIVHNESGTLFVKLGTAATSVSYTYRLVANTLLEITGYTGAVTAIKASGASSALVTEL